jgi:hypothetical protein
MMDQVDKNSSIVECNAPFSGMDAVCSSLATSL